MFLLLRRVWPTNEKSLGWARAFANLNYFTNPGEPTSGAAIGLGFFWRRHMGELGQRRMRGSPIENLKYCPSFHERGQIGRGRAVPPRRHHNIGVARGLRQRVGHRDTEVGRVAPRAGAWIETTRYRCGGAPSMYKRSLQTRRG